MKKAIVLIVVIVAFVAGCRISSKPAWIISELILAKAVTENMPKYFPVLMLDNEKYLIGNLDGASSSPFVSTTISNETVERINNDLIPVGPDYVISLFIVRSQGNDYVDVETIVLPKSAAFYRIQGGKIIPQKALQIGPMFASILIALTCLSGFLASLIAWIVIKRFWPNKATIGAVAAP